MSSVSDPLLKAQTKRQLNRKIAEAKQRIKERYAATAWANLTDRQTILELEYQIRKLN